MKIINELDINQKVGEIWIRLNNSNPINEEIIRMIINSYNNVYSIHVRDDNDSVDNINHDQIKQLLRQSIVMEFTLLFNGGDLKHNNDGL